MDQQARKLGQGVNDAREKLADTMDAIAEKTNSTRDRLADSVTAVGEATAHATATVTDRLPDSQTVKEGLRNPLVWTVGLVAGGVIAGLVAPLTDYERRTLRPLGNEVARRAADARDEVIDQSKAVLTETVAAARESAERHGHDLANKLGVEGEADVSKVG